MRWMPYFAAGLLASLTIRVFFELQDYGPESAIRHFYQATPNAIQTGSLADLQALSAEQIQGANETLMIARLAFWRSHGVSMQVGRIERTGNEVRAAVIFSFENGTIWAPVWVLQRRGKLWLVDFNKTSTIFWDFRPPSLTR